MPDELEGRCIVDEKKRPGRFYLFIKRSFDIIVSFIGLIFLIPITLIVGLAIKIEDGGPVFFKQTRVTKNGKLFKLYKYRSMVVNAEKIRDTMDDENEMDGPVFKVKDDKRITKVGHFIRKTSIDELPQLINVFLGDMSIVGPRPALPREVEEYDSYAKRRLEVKAGLTCIWQVQKNRNNISFKDWMDMDVEYVENQSIALDLKLIFKTFRAVLTCQGE